MWLTVDLKKNFWDCNPDLAVIEPFTTLIETLGKRRSSNILWNIYLAYYPSSPFCKKYKKLEDRFVAINDEFNTKDSIVNFNDYTDITDNFINICIPQSFKTLDHWEKTLADYDLYLDGLTFTQNFKNKTEGLSKQKMLWDMFKIAKEEFDKDVEEGRSVNRAGYQGSMLENGSYYE